ncbi:MAG: hypothetical protein GOV00_03895 [Candidatus Altiarchaeota archaeon]|nr:hypothetical protein [Candidatus Altiarchaeota archaeon]
MNKDKMEMMNKPNLLPHVKNYWFIYGNEGPRQFLFMWGTQKGILKVNGHKVSYPDYFVVFWGYDPKEGKLVKIDQPMKLDFPPKGPFDFKFSDNKYFLKYGDTNLIFDKFYAEDDNDGVWKLAKWHNEYRHFSGKLFGKSISGKAYVQKVEAKSPFSSWNWLRFQGKDVGTLFQLLPKKTSLKFNGVIYPVKVSSDNGKLHLQSDKVDLKTTPYETFTVNFSGLGKFRYTEFLVEIEGTVDGKKVHEFGLVEEARGLIV